MTVLFWALVILTAFAIALAAQMRMMISVVLRRALAAKFGGEPSDAVYRAAIFAIGRGPADSEAGQYLQAEYPRPLTHLALARRISLFAPLVLLVVVLAGRFALGAI